MVIYCTVTSNQYIFLAMALSKSIKQADPGAKILMCLVEEDYSYASQYLGYFDYVILAKELGFTNFYQHIFKHSAYEASGSCKARLMQYALKTFHNEDKFVYLDSDIKVFGPFDEIKNELKNHNIILSPHILLAHGNNEAFYKTGIFNTGFFALKRSQETTQFLNWWTDRIEKACFNEPDLGMFLEQKWLDHAPVFFNINICRHPGYNVAAWNLHQRKIERASLGKYKVNGQPLKLFHFSSILKFGQAYYDFLKKVIPNLDPIVGTLVYEYIKELENLTRDFTKMTPWSYDFYSDGNPIDFAARIAFRQNPQNFAAIANPFLESNNTFISHINKDNPKMKKRLMQRKHKKKVKISWG